MVFFRSTSGDRQLSHSGVYVYIRYKELETDQKKELADQ